MSDRSQLRAMVMRDEGLKLKPYKDTRGKLSIGFGRCLDDAGISVQEATTMLDSDLQHAETVLAHAFPWFEEIPPARQDVLISMAFNMGIGGLLEFREMLAAIERRDFGTAAVQMRESHWAGQVGDRAHRLAQIMEAGDYPAP